MYDLEVIGLIPVKSFSKRFPEKNFSEFCPETGFRGNLISNTIEKLVKARVDKIFISTDKPEKIIGKKEYSPPAAYTELYVIGRHTEETQEKPEITMNEVVLDFIEHTKVGTPSFISGKLPDNYIICLCQVTSPNWSPHRLVYAISRMKQHKKPVISVSPDFQPNGCFYVFTKGLFLECLDIYTSSNGIYLTQLTWDESIDIDYYHQLRIAEAISRGDCDEL